VPKRRARVADVAPGDGQQTSLARLLSTEPADRGRAETAVRELYASAGFAAPRHLCWFDSPFAAAWVVALLIERRHYAWRPLIEAERRSRDGRKAIETAEATICHPVGRLVISAFFNDYSMSRMTGDEAAAIGPTRASGCKRSGHTGEEPCLSTIAIWPANMRPYGPS